SSVSRLVALLGGKNLGIEENKRQGRDFLDRGSAGPQAVVELTRFGYRIIALRGVLDLELPGQARQPAEIGTYEFLQISISGDTHGQGKRIFGLQLGRRRAHLDAKARADGAAEIGRTVSDRRLRRVRVLCRAGARSRGKSHASQKHKV